MSQELNPETPNYLPGMLTTQPHILRIFCQLFKAQWQLYVPPALTISNSASCTYGFRMILSVKRDYFSKQHFPVYLCNGEVVFSLSTDRILKNYLDELWLQRVNIADEGKKKKVVPVTKHHTKDVYSGGGGKIPHILYLNFNMVVSGQLYTVPVLPQGMSP
jgi:hypothetical protein